VSLLNKCSPSDVGHGQQSVKLDVGPISQSTLERCVLEMSHANHLLVYTANWFGDSRSNS